MNTVMVIDAPGYKVKLTVTPLVNSNMNEVVFTKVFYNDGITSNSSTFTLYLDQDGISKIINALQATKTPSWSLANDDHR